jgi:hypothetical protein
MQRDTGNKASLSNATQNISPFLPQTITSVNVPFQSLEQDFLKHNCLHTQNIPQAVSRYSVL